MNPGKVSEVTYKRAILKNLDSKIEGVKPGVNAASMQLEDITIVMSSNCILKRFDDFEQFYVRRLINNISEKCGVPRSLQITVTAPMEFDEKNLNKIIRNFRQAANAHNLDINQCGIYRGMVSDPIINVTVIGTTKYSLSTDNIKSGMDVVMAGTLAIGGTAIIANKLKSQLSDKFSGKFVADCLQLKNYISIEKVANTAMENGAVYMHNVSEGGLFGGIWEVASCVDKGIEVDINSIPIWQEAIEVAEFANINPYLLEGSGSLLIVSSDGYKIVEALRDNGIYSEVIGKITDGKDRVVINGDEVRYLEPPRGDELYKLI